MTLSQQQLHLLERVVQRLLFSSRWLLVPIYFALAALLVGFSVHVVRELVHIANTAFSGREIDFIATTLTMLDLTLMAGLVVMVMLSGYEIFVSRLNVVEEEGSASVAWLGRLDFGTLKLRVLVAIVIISAVELLKVMIDIGEYPIERVTWMVVIHLTLVASALALAWLDRLTTRSRR